MCSTDPLLRKYRLLTGDGHATAVLRPTLFVGSGALRALFAIRDDGHAVGRDTESRQIVPHRIGAPLAQGQVVLTRPALVGWRSVACASGVRS